METTAKTFSIVSGIVVGYLFGGWSFVIELLLVLTIADYVTGMIASGVEGKLNSKVGFKGIFKKVMIFCIVAVGHFVDLAIGQGNMVMNATGFFYAGNELLSIIENAGRAGAPVPDVFKRAVDILRSKGSDNDGPK